MKDFEKDIKKYFHERRIQPSENAWERMEQLLDEKKPVKRKRFGYVWTIAASIILAVGLWSVFKKTNEFPIEQNEQNVFVTNDSIVPKNEQIQEKQEIVTHNPPEKQEAKPEKQKEPVSKVLEKPQWSPDEEEQTETEHFIAETQPVYKPEKKEIKEEVLPPRSNVEIKVNREKLLFVAEIERQVEKTSTDGQNFWRSIKEINTVAENYKSKK